MDLKPHRSTYWLNSKAKRDDPVRHAAQEKEICELYAQALVLHEQGVNVISTDEKTGIQALERAAPTLPMRPGREELREFEYIRHGTQCLTANFEVATGNVIELPTAQPLQGSGSTRGQTELPLSPAQGGAYTFRMQTDGAICASCGWTMIRSGSCYKCENCGSTSGCS